MASVLQVATIKDQGGNANAIEIANSSANVTINNLAGGAIGSAVTGFAGVKEADQWRLHTSFTGLKQPISSNLERNDANFSIIGTGMSVSSGVFTFPQTGIYYMTFKATFSLNGDCRYIAQIIKHEGSSNIIAKNYVHITRTSTNTTYTAGFIDCIVDVANTSTDKVSFHISELDNTGVNTLGSQTAFYTGFTFIRLGDT